MDQNGSDEQWQLNELRIRLESGYREFQKTGEYLSRRQLNSMEEHLPKLELDPVLLGFVKESRADATRKEKKEVRRLRGFVVAVSFVAVGAILLGILAYSQTMKAEKNLRNFHSTQAEKVSGEVNNILDRAETLHYRGYERESVLLLKEAENLLEENKKNPLLKTQIHKVDSLLMVYEK